MTPRRARRIVPSAPDPETHPQGLWMLATIECRAYVSNGRAEAAVHSGAAYKHYPRKRPSSPESLHRLVHGHLRGQARLFRARAGH